MKKQKQDHKRSVYAETVRRWVENNIPKEELENNEYSNMTHIFAKKSVSYEIFQELQQKFIDALMETPLPEGFRPPIASGKRREKTSRRNVETLLANLLNMKMKGKSSLSVSLSPNTYSNTKVNAGFINLFKLAAHRSRQLLILKKGFQDIRRSENSRQGRIIPGRKFWELMDTAIVSEDDIVSEPHDLINLRQGKTKEIVPRIIWERNNTKEQAEKLHTIELGLCWFNLVCSEYEMGYIRAEDGEKHFLYPILYIVYTDDFQHGGRLYTGKGGHQSLSKIERSTIRFNGHPTTELDFGGLHIRMLYHLAGIEYPLDKDPYAAVLETMGKNPEKIFKQFPAIRDDLKTMLLALINGTIEKKDKFKEAIRRADYRLFNEWTKIKNPHYREDKKLECELHKERWIKAGLLDDEGKTSKVIRAFLKAHSLIENEFSSGRGLNLQNIDGTIAFWILCEMMFSPNNSDCSIPCLPIHDSFITFTAYKNKLKTAMKMIYESVMQLVTKSKKSFKIPVKEQRL